MMPVPGGTPSAAEITKSTGIHCFATWANAVHRICTPVYGQPQPWRLHQTAETHWNYAANLQSGGCSCNSLALSISPATLEKTYLMLSGYDVLRWQGDRARQRWPPSLSKPDRLVLQGVDAVGENGSTQLMPKRRKVPASEHCGSLVLPLRQAMRLEAIGRHSNSH